jgi:hypothetical protein
MLTHINKTGTSACWRMIKETVPINSSLQLRSQYSQDVAECKLMFEKSTGFNRISPVLSHFTNNTGQINGQKRFPANYGEH